MSRVIMVICLISSLSGCAARTGPSCAPGFGRPVAIFPLFMGKATPRRADLTDKEWREFLDTTITANLPNGYTVLDATGGWMNPMTHATIKEGTKVLLVALPDTQDSLAAISRIRAAYQIEFQQKVVGVTVEPACGAF
jgi:hypothetical protein